MTREPAGDDRPDHCPLCDGPNGCAMATGDGTASCWCAGETFPASLIERVPMRARGRRCVCRRCLERDTTDLRDRDA